MLYTRIVRTRDKLLLTRTILEMTRLNPDGAEDKDLTDKYLHETPISLGLHTPEIRSDDNRILIQKRSPLSEWQSSYVARRGRCKPGPASSET